LSMGWSKPKPPDTAAGDLLTFARSFEQEGLDSVVNDLRRARNEVVWKMGE
jgi:hypothetical protein